MDITFKDKTLGKCANNDRKLEATYGKLRASKLRQRLSALRDAENLEVCRHLPGHFEELILDRKGQWSCRLDGPYRLIFIPHQDPIPTTPKGGYSWIEIVGVEIIEIVDYHKVG